VADGVDAPMERMEIPAPHPRENRVGGQATRAQLGNGEHAPLPGSEARDRDIGSSGQLFGLCPRK